MARGKTVEILLMDRLQSSQERAGIRGACFQTVCTREGLRSRLLGAWLMLPVSSRCVSFMDVRAGAGAGAVTVADDSSMIILWPSLQRPSPSPLAYVCVYSPIPGGVNPVY